MLQQERNVGLASGMVAAICEALFYVLQTVVYM
jgi:hypothetical protein